MGPFCRRRLIALAVCFALAALLANRPLEAQRTLDREPLSVHLAAIDGWRLHSHIPMEERVVQMLKLDDHAFATYGNGRDLITLYIGYYFTREKVGAPHHPLVCFTGQGWELSEVGRAAFRLEDGTQLPVSVMTAGRDEERQYIAYWFQAQEEAAPGPFLQKLSLTRQRLLNGGQESAFVRISLPAGDRSEEECRRAAEAFVRAFYPSFLTYIRGRSA